MTRIVKSLPDPDGSAANALCNTIRKLAAAQDAEGLMALYFQAREMRATGEDLLEAPLTLLLEVLEIDRQHFEHMAELLSIELERAAADAEYREAIARAEYAAAANADDHYTQALTAARGY